MSKNKLWYIFLLFLMTSFLMFTCAGHATASAVNFTSTHVTGTHVTVTDDYGTKVSVPSNPQKIVSLSPSNTEILGALGLIDRVVGVTDYSNYPAEAATKTNVGGYTAINSEKVVNLEPDLIIADLGNGNETIEYLRGLGLNVVVLDPKDINGIFKDIVLVGKATGTEDKANSLVSSLRERINSIKKQVANANTTPTVAHVVSYDPIYVAGKNTYQDEVISLAGGKNAFSNIDEWGTVNIENLLSKDPDYILINSGSGMSDANGSNPVYDYFKQNTQVQSLKAVQNNHLILVDADVISRGGPRIVDAIEMVAKVIHPECFSLPVSNFSTNTTSGDAPLSIQFTDLSQNATGWNWDFGDGATSTDQSPMHTYSTAGTYTANLTVSNANGASSQTTKINVKESSSSGGSSSSHHSSSSGSGSISSGNTNTVSASLENESNATANVTANVTEAAKETQSEPNVQDSEQNSTEANITQPSEQTQSSNTSENENTKTSGFEIASGIVCLACAFLYKRR